MVEIIFLFFILLVLAGLSIFLAYSGYLEGRTYIGWAYLVVFLVIYFQFVSLWYKKMDTAFGMYVSALGLTLLLMTQGPLVVELISQALLPDPSKGLKLVKVYSEAEKKVAQDDLPGAILEYEKVIAKDPEDIVARFRLADLCHQNEDYRKAALAYESIIARKQQLSMSQHCSALTRLSELYSEHLHDVQKAGIFVQAIIDQYPGTKYADYAAERLKNLPDA